MLPVPCLQDVGGCGLKNSVVYSLAYLPRVFTLQVLWDSHCNFSDSASTGAVLMALNEQVGSPHYG